MRPKARQVKLNLLVLLCSAFAVVLVACTGSNLKGSSTGWSPAVASDGIVYVGTKQGEVKALEDRGFDSLRVKWTYCVEWKTSAQVDCEKGLGGVYGSPVLGPELLYLSGVDGYLYALDRETGTVGEKGWRRPVGLGQELKPLIGGPALAIDKNGRGVLVVGSEDHNLYAFEAVPKRSGSGPEANDPLLWHFTAGDKIWSTPIIEGGTVYFGAHDHNVYALDLSTGKELWRFPTGGVVAGRPLRFNNVVVAGAFDNKLYGINAKDGTLEWQVEGDNWFWAGAVANERTIFAPSMDGNIYAIDGDGNVLWKHDMGSPIVSRPVLVPRGLVVAGKNGKVSLLATNPSPTAVGREISSFFIKNKKGGNAEIKAPLFAVDDAVFVGSQDSTVTRINMSNQREVWCFNTNTPSSAGEPMDITCK